MAVSIHTLPTAEYIPPPSVINYILRHICRVILACGFIHSIANEVGRYLHMVFDIRKHCQGLNEIAASRRVGVRHSLAPLVPPKKTIEKKNQYSLRAILYTIPKTMFI